MTQPTMLAWDLDEIALDRASQERNRNLYNNASRFKKTLFKRNLRFQYRMDRVARS